MAGGLNLHTSTLIYGTDTVVGDEQNVVAYIEPIAIDADSHSVLLIGKAQMEITDGIEYAWQWYRAIGTPGDPATFTLGDQVGGDIVQTQFDAVLGPANMMIGVDPDPPGAMGYALVLDAPADLDGVIIRLVILSAFTF